jgi:mRNA interferase MazF
VFNERSGTIIPMALTSRPRRASFPLTLELAVSKLPKHSWVKVSQIRTLAVERVGKRPGRATSENLAQVLDGLWEIIGASPAFGADEGVANTHAEYAEPQRSGRRCLHR